LLDSEIISYPFIGKQWHEPKTAFRPKAGNSTYEKRQEERKAMAATKAKEKEMKDEKEAERQVCNP
jgi:rRNA-processing protein CGR1